MKKKEGPSEQDLKDAYMLNDAVNKGDISPGYASNATDEYIKDVELGLHRMDREEYERTAKKYPNFETNEVFKVISRQTLVYNVMRKLYPYSEDREHDRSRILDKTAVPSIINHLKRTVGKGEEVTEDLLKDDSDYEEVKKALAIQKELEKINDYQKIVEWCEKHEPPIKLTLWDHGYIKLCALRGFNMEQERIMKKNAPRMVQ